MKSGFILLGIVLLIASVLGAKMVYDHDARAGDKSKTEANANQPPEWILSWGFFDRAKGVVPLYPRQFGNVTSFTPENTKVKEGHVLIQVDDELAKLKINEAQEDANAATQQVALAKQLTKVYEFQRTEQKAAVDALVFQKKRLEAKRDSELALLENNKAQLEKVKALYVFALDELAEKKKSEDAKLEQVKLQDAKLKIAQAEADLGAKTVRLDEAKAMLKHFQVKAPSDGIVLRVHVHIGETLGPNPRTPAVEFLPAGETIVRAEVLQEWGRFVKKDQEVEIEDDTYHGPKWHGTVKSISEWYAPPRSAVLEPFRLNDVRTLEVIISVKDAAGSRNGQRVRAKIKVQ